VTDDLDRQSDAAKAAHAAALDRVRSAFVLLMTSVGMPMFVAGEEFADVHDLFPGDYRLKMSDPPNFSRALQPARARLVSAVAETCRLRVRSAALQAAETELFYFHPSFDDNDGVRVFAYARTAGRPLGSSDQVVVIANMGNEAFPEFVVPWTWNGADEVAPPAGGQALTRASVSSTAMLSLAPCQARLFVTR
jgi:hypothetical protein